MLLRRLANDQLIPIDNQGKNMRLGLVTDIHNAYENLARALELFRIHEVDQVVTLGDSCDAFAAPDGADKVALLLSSCNAVGVWGNHDLHLCRDVSADCRERFAPATIDFMESMQPFLEIDGYRFSHRDASIDAYDIEQLWLKEDSRDLRGLLGSAFASSRNARQFIGHYHCWWAATPSGRIPWDGTNCLTLVPSERYVVIIAGVVQGKCAILDTSTGVLEPWDCASG